MNQALHYFARVMAKCGEQDSLLGLAAKEQKEHNLEWYSFWSQLHNDDGPARQTLERAMVSHWDALRQTQSKMKFYNAVKLDYGYEEYLDMRRVDRKEISKLRLSSHDLRVETARYKQRQNTPTHCRFCCDDEHRGLLNNLPFPETVIEDEEHALATCPAYSASREQLPDELRSALSEKNLGSLFRKDHCRQLNNFLKECKTIRDNV